MSMDVENGEINWDAVLYDAIQDESINADLSMLNKLSPELILQILSHLPWNEALSTAPVCSLFRDLLQSASLWTNLRNLNFMECNIPLARHILKVVSQCPATEKLALSEIIIDENEFEEEIRDDGKISEHIENNEENVDDAAAEDDNMVVDPDIDEEEPEEKPVLTIYDKFIAKVARQCPHLKDLTLESHLISEGTVEVIHQEVPGIETLRLSSAERLQSKHIEKLLGYATRLKCLEISQCELHYPMIKQKSGTHLTLTSLSLIRCGIRKMDIAIIGQNCPQLKYLDLSESSVFDIFGPPEVVASNFQHLEILRVTYCRDMEQLILEDLPALNRVETNQSGYLSYVKLKCLKLCHVEVDGCTSLTEMVVHSDHLESLVLSPHFPVLSGLNVKCPRLSQLTLYNCPMLRRDQIAAMEGLDKTKQLTMRCLQVSFDDIATEILPKLQSLEEISLQGFGSSSLAIASNTLKTLDLQELMYTAELSLETPQLTALNISNMRVLSEEDLVNGLSYSLQELRLCEIAGLHGSMLSQHGDLLRNLSTLVIKDCRFMKILTLVNWQSLSSVSVSGCPYLKHILVQCANIKILHFWWLHTNSFTVEAPNLELLDLKGSDFQNFRVASQSLDQLEVSGLCTDSNTSLWNVDIQCPSMKHLWIQKSPFLTSNMIKKILHNCPSVTDLHIMYCQEIREISVPASIRTLKLAGLYHLADVMLDSGCKLEAISLSGLPKITPDTRRRVLSEVAAHIENLQLRLMNEEITFCIMYSNVTSLSVDQGLHLNTLEIRCPKLKVLRIKGCPNLTKLLLEVDSVSELDVSQSMPLNALQSLHVVTSSAKHLAKILSLYCPRLQVLELTVNYLSLAQIVRFGLHHRNLERVFLYSGAEWDQQLSMLFPRTFHVPYHVLDRPTEKDLHVSFN